MVIDTLDVMDNAVINYVSQIVNYHFLTNNYKQSADDIVKIGTV